MLGVRLLTDFPWAVTVQSDPRWKALGTLGGWAAVSPFVTWCPQIPTLASPHLWASKEHVISWQVLFSSPGRAEASLGG